MPTVLLLPLLNIWAPPWSLAILLRHYRNCGWLFVVVYSQRMGGYPTEGLHCQG